VWGEYSLEERLSIAAGASQKNKKATTRTPAGQLQIMEANPPLQIMGPPERIIRKLERCNHWYEIYDDPVLRKLAVKSYENIRNLYEDLQALSNSRATLGERFLSYLHRQPAEYELEELPERYLLLDWLASCLCFHRPIVPNSFFMGCQKPKEDSSSICYLLYSGSFFSPAPEWKRLLMREIRTSISASWSQTNPLPSLKAVPGSFFIKKEIHLS
jgi:hypothetical protein